MPPASSPPPSAPPSAPPSRLIGLVAALASSPGRDFRFDELLELLRHAGFGALLGLVTLLSAILPGAGIVFGLFITTLGAQILAGRERPWVPGLLGRRVVPSHVLAGLTRRLGRFAPRLERLVRPRWSGLTRSPMFALTGLAVMLLGLGLALPLPLPGSNLMFAFPLLVYALGLLEDDGMVLAIGHALAAADVTLCVVFWDLVTDAIHAAARWIGGLLA